MKADNKTLMAVKNYLRDGESLKLDEFVAYMIEKINLINVGEGEHNISVNIDECDIMWGDNNVCGLDEFVEAYTNIFMRQICKVLDSFIDDDIDYYLEGEDL